MSVDLLTEVEAVFLKAVNCTAQARAKNFFLILVVEEVIESRFVVEMMLGVLFYSIVSVKLVHSLFDCRIGSECTNYAPCNQETGICESCPVGMGGDDCSNACKFCCML